MDEFEDLWVYNEITFSQSVHNDLTGIILPQMFFCFSRYAITQLSSSSSISFIQLGWMMPHEIWTKLSTSLTHHFHHDDAMPWKCFPQLWRLVCGIPRLPLDSHRKGWQYRVFMVSLLLPWIIVWTNSFMAGEVRRLDPFQLKWTISKL